MFTSDYDTDELHPAISEGEPPILAYSLFFRTPMDTGQCAKDEERLENMLIHPPVYCIDPDDGDDPFEGCPVVFPQRLAVVAKEDDPFLLAA